MAQVINTNVMSLNAQRNLNSTSTAMSTSIQRLSSGLRINSAKDDAAGLAISERFTTQIRGLDVAARNANDGISLAQTAEGALSEIGNNLQRIRELAVQSRNATNSATDREALQAEVAQLKSEIDRVATQTSFNGTSLLDGSFTNKAFQVGADQGQLINIAQITNAKIDSLGSWTSVDTTAASYTGAVPAGAASGGTFDAGSFSLTGGGGTATISFTAADNAADRANDLVEAINAETENTGVTASLVEGKLSLQSAGGDITIAADQAGMDGVALLAQTGLEVGTTAGGEIGTAFVGAQTGFSDLDISTEKGSDNAILAMDAALNEVNSARAELGAIQNRFSSVVSNLSITSENLSASRSRIRDTDYAKETAELTRTQILQQAGTAMLAQAKSIPQNVLSLLQ